MKLRERDLEIEFTDAIDALVFDQMDKAIPGFHGLAEMHRVDFIVEFDDDIIFVEVKDPSNPMASAKGLRKFHDALQDGTLGSTFASKFIDSFLYRWAEDKVNKPIHYLGLVTLDSELLSSLSDEILKKIPPMGRTLPRWKRSLVGNCQLFNIETWNNEFPKWPVSRLVSTEAKT
ncbi:hypothetical protein [Halopseudomonas sp.]|jgi:hypothetical protein|uniref:hypothetical protein n=1 Tax=Halopseudomonas sp. TaxID=2901191 RepID=UPI0039E408F0